VVEDEIQVRQIGGPPPGSSFALGPLNPLTVNRSTAILLTKYFTKTVFDRVQENAMLRKITRAGQVSVPKKALAQFDLKEGDYVDIDCTPSAIVIKPVTVSEFSDRDLERFAAKLAEIEEESGEAMPSFRRLSLPSW
jgi:AbrB family looped-hinge helix DNA binding protein